MSIKMSRTRRLGARSDIRWDRETERFSDFQVYRQVVFARQFDWKITGLLALENPGHIHLDRDRPDLATLVRVKKLRSG